MEVFLCRHGETDHNNNGIVQGQKDVDLNDNGRKQAHKLAERLNDESFDFFYSSALSWAYETAEIVAQEQVEDIEVEKTSLLNEVDRSIFEGEDFEDMVEAIRDSKEESHLWKPEGGETLVEMQKRGTKFLEHIEEKHSYGDKILAVAHGGINGGIIMGALNHSAENCYKIDQDNCCMNKLVLDEAIGWRIKTVNNT